jgi:hypothetical protein
MPERQTAKQSARRTTGKSTKGFTAEERAAMRERAREARRGSDADGESDLLAKIAEMSEPDHTRAERVHAIVKASAPDIESKTWYGMPAYAKAGKTICFFQPAEKFKSRFAMLGFSDKANLDDGEMWPVYYALTDMTPDVEARIGELVKQAVS